MALRFAGWVDMFANFADPVMNIKNQLNLAVWLLLPADLQMYLVIPNTKPAIDAKSQVEYIVQKSRSLAVSVHPIGAVTKNAEGKELSRNV
jgi:dihydroorotase